MNSVGPATATLWPARHRGLGISWPLLIGTVGFLVPVVMGYGLQDGDTYLQVAVGRWMIAHGHILTQDPFSFTRFGAPSTAQEWGADLLLAATFRVAGWSGLVVLSAISFGATLAYLMRFLQSRMEPLHALVLSLLTASMMLPWVFARPHALVWPFTAVWVGTVVGSSEDNRAPPWWLLGVLLIWVNMHGSFIVGIGVVAFLACDSILEAKTDRWGTARRWLPFVLAAFACGFVNPQGYRLMLFPFHLLGMKAAMSLVSEWRPPDFEHPQMLGLWVIAILGLGLSGRIRLSLVRSILVLGLFYTALQHVRNVALLGLVSPFLLARPVAALWREMPVPGGDAGAIDRWFRSLACPARRSAVCTMLALAISIAIVSLGARRPLPPDDARPRAAVDAVIARVPGGRILNDPAFGDYLIYRGIPDFMDDRVDLYGDTFIKRTADALALLPGGDLGALLKQYKIQAIILEPRWPATKVLDRSPDWERIYSDEAAVAYVRRGGYRS